ncbi:MAG: hypothetical protein Q9209_005885 [Squamulea sp. 1 TL-2023]
MDDGPEPEISFSGGNISVKLPGTDNASLDSVHLHELAILREHAKPGPIALGLITEYFNIRYGHHWTVGQIVRVWRKLRQEFEKDDTIHKGHVILTWRENYPNCEPDDPKKKIYDEILDVTMDQFFETMSSILPDSSKVDSLIDMDLERKAFGNVTILTSVIAELGAIARQRWPEETQRLFSHDQGPTMLKHFNASKSSQQLSEEALERIQKTRAYETDLHEWKRQVFAEGDMPARKPLKTDAKYKEPLAMAW